MKPRKPLLAFLVVLILFLFFIFSKNQENQVKKTISVPSSKAFSVVLNGQIPGIALLSEKGGKVKVDLTVTSKDSIGAIVESGDCKTKGEKIYALNELREGKSETVIDVSFDDLLEKLPLSIKAYDDTRTSCGQISISK